MLAELLFWPALVLYAEAALAFAGNARYPGLAGKLATWGVRLGWLFHTALLIEQVVKADGFAWTSWAGSLSLFVWLVAAAYLVWGCKPRYRLLGLVVMPLVTAMLLAAWAGGGTGTHAPSGGSTAFLVLHVAFVLVAFAGFTMSAYHVGIAPVVKIAPNATATMGSMTENTSAIASRELIRTISRSHR